LAIKGEFVKVYRKEIEHRKNNLKFRILGDERRRRRLGGYVN
jgi:hypothetical protein